MEEARKRQKEEEEEAIRRMKEKQANEERDKLNKEIEEKLAKYRLGDEIREKEDIEKIERHRIEREKREKQANEKRDKFQKLTEKALDIEKQVNQGRKSHELARQVSLNGEYIGFASDTHKYTFKISWMCPNFAYKEVSLIINNEKDVLLYEHLYVTGSQTIELSEIKSEIRVTLRLGLYDVYAYRIILIEMDKQLNEFIISGH